MTIHFQIGIQESEDSFDVHTLYECDTEREDLGSSEVAPFQTYEGAFAYMLEQVNEYKETMR